jgi:hypothetical protein
LNIPLGLELRHFALQPRDLGLLGLQLPVAGKGMGGIVRKRLHPTAQHRLMHAEVA